MSYLIDLLPQKDLLQVFQIFNLVIAVFGALMMFFVKTETSDEGHNWTRYLAIALSIFAVQYAINIAGIPETTRSLFSLNDSYSYVWSEIFSLCINGFLLATAMTLLNKSPRLPPWFFVLIAMDLAVVLFMRFGHLTEGSTYLVSTLCRALRDSISFISLMYFGYASYINMNFYKSHSGIVLWVSIGVIYGGIHLIKPFAPNIAAHYGSAELNLRIMRALTFVAALLKLVILLSVCKITALENQTLITLRDKLRESVDDRKFFFSRKGILVAIHQAFGVDRVTLYIRVPSVENAANGLLVHKYWWPSEAPSEYEVVSESETPIPTLIERILDAKAKESRREAEQRGGLRLSRIVRDALVGTKRAPFDGLAPIRYHGALIGCLTIEKGGMRHFTYSAEKLFQLVSEDISVLLQFYRLNESLRALIKGLERNLKTPRAIKSDAGPTMLSKAELGEQFEAVIQGLLSPLETRFLINTGFRKIDNLPTVQELNLAAKINGRKPANYECCIDEAGVALTIGHLHLQYQKERDPLENPSLGYFRTYGEAVAYIVTRFFLSAIQQKFDLIIKHLSAKLAGPMTFETWLGEIQESVKAAELEGVVVYAPEAMEFQQLVRAEDAAASRAIGARLDEAFPEKTNIFALLEAERLEVVQSAGEGLILGMKLPHREAAILVGVSRKEFANELKANIPWRGFLLNLAEVAGNAFDRIMTALEMQKKAREIQKEQIEWMEAFMAIKMADKVNALTHTLVNRIENLDQSAALTNLEVSLLEVDDSMKKPIERRIEEVRSEFAQLRSLAAGIRSSTQILDESGPCPLMKTLEPIVKLHETRSHVRIELVEGVRVGPSSTAPAQMLADVLVSPPLFVVEQTFGNLISNSIAAIERKKSEGRNGSDGFNRPDVIRIWAEVDESGKFINCFVYDTGVGVAANIRDAIFDMNVTTTPGKGGWGLFTVKRMLRDIGGAVQLDHSEWGDTTFRVSLPKFSNSDNA
jgi:signal transduction histidine kinase